MAIHKIITPYEIFIYMNGKLTYKKWFNSTQSLVFDIMPYDRHTLVSITDEGSTNNIEKRINSTELDHLIGTNLPK